MLINKCRAPLDYLNKLMLVLWCCMLPSCQQSKSTIPVSFIQTFNATQINCEESLVIKQDAWKITQLQYFIHDIYFRDVANIWHLAQPIVPAGDNQQVVLVGDVCPHDVNKQLSLETELSAANITGIKFTVGVPYNINHLNPLVQSSPLNQPDMFWTWQMGHKFARVELESDLNQWIFHLGSTGCSSASPVRAPQTECINPNRAEIVLENYTPGKSIAFNLDSLINDIDLIAQSNCQSAPDNSLCQILLPRFGIGNPQTVFSISKN